MHRQGVCVTLLAEGKLTDEAIYAIMQEEKAEPEGEVHHQRIEDRKSATAKRQGIAEGGFHPESHRLLCETPSAEKGGKGALDAAGVSLPFPSPHPILQILSDFLKEKDI